MRSDWSIAALLCMAAAAQTPPPPPAQAPAAPPSVAWSALVDGYYSLNFNHPASGVNGLRNFDVRADQFSLNMAKLTLEHTAEPLGFRVDAGFGRAFDVFHANEKGAFRYLEQAYVAFKPARAKGLQLDFGKFVTAAGAEVIETHSNWNYSRSLLFAWAIPYYHFGARATMPVGGHFTAGVHVVNGWNNVDENNSGKTVGFSGAVSAKGVTWTHTYHVGPEKPNGQRGLRHLYDTTLLVNAGGRTSFYLNFDYGVDKNPGLANNRWVGVAGAARFALNRWLAIAPRLEWFNDADGFATGTAQRLKEFTLTGEFKMRDGLLSRLEYRRDWSDQPFFDRGHHPGSYRNQDTVLLGFVAFFGQKR